MIVTIHQPEHLPWLGFFDKLRQADVWVMLDHVQFTRGYYQNRNRIQGPNGPVWITVPAKIKDKFGQAINEVEIDNVTNPRWRERCWNSLQFSYRKAAHFGEHAGFFEGLYAKPWNRLVDLNEAIILYLLEALAIRPKIVKSSTLDIRSSKADLVLEICEKMKADCYLSGVSGKDYLDPAKFAERGVELRFQEFHHPIYRQLHEPFLSCMSAVDLLFNHGPRSLDIIKGVGVETMDKVFL